MLYIWMPEAEGTWCWSSGTTWHVAASLEQLIQQLQTESSRAKLADAVVFFSSQQAQLLTQTIPKAQYKQLVGDGVKYLLEDYVTLPVDQMQVRHQFEAPDQVHLLGVAQHSVETWRHSLALLPIHVVALLPDFLLLPAPINAQQVVLAQICGRLIARHGTLQGQSVDDLALFLSYQNGETEILSTGLSTEQLQQFEQLRGQPAQHFDYRFDPTGLNKQHAFNILPKSKSNHAWSGYWKACAALLLAIVVVQLSYDLLRYAKFKALADQTAEQAVEQYKTWFGRNNRVTEQNLKSQFQSQIQSSKTGNWVALDLLSRVGPILMQKQMTAQELRFDASTLSLLVRAKTSDDLQALTQQLNQQGFKAELGNIQADGAAAVGILKVNE